MEPATIPSGTLDGWLSQEDLGARWKVSKQTIRRLRKSGRLPALQLTRALFRFKLKDILRLEAEGIMLPALAPRRIARKPAAAAANGTSKKPKPKG
jgi:hypothetical protein